MTTSPLLQIRALRRLHVGPIELELGAGECLAITGASGAGKSILLRMIADLDPHEGEMALEGTPCSGMLAPAWRRQVTYVASESGWWRSVVSEHLTETGDLPARLAAVGLAQDAGSWPVARLSTGERQRLALLRALCATTRVLLLDEPTAGLDAATTEQVEALLQRELARGVAILIVTHDPAQAARLATRRFVLEGGKLEALPL